ncbi:BLUF domain-containing protein [Sphingomonas sp. H160509]|uniref:BLUF domain-containing protein n=1 Tax=Sphingomonas sp. H160509 TaxID=2955313 RepID=UPI0020973A48|nr:BLUF domain-containing protein [Sphingomonas sp. H160509]MDD1449918.1 BLUF domain-containing protein [Sphingomonas sp. H160509]
MHRLIYTSKSLIGSNLAELDVIVRQASRLNEAAGLTGMLWADEDRFVQVLEGDHDIVARTVRRIRADPRHEDMEMLCDRSVVQRMFGTWSMVRSNQEPEGTASTAFLVGLVRG